LIGSCPGARRAINVCELNHHHDIINLLALALVAAVQAGERVVQLIQTATIFTVLNWRVAEPIATPTTNQRLSNLANWWSQSNAVDIRAIHTGWIEIRDPSTVAILQAEILRCEGTARGRLDQAHPKAAPNTLQLSDRARGRYAVCSRSCQGA